MTFENSSEAHVTKKQKQKKKNFTGDKCHLLLLPYQGRRREHMGFMKKHFGHALA